MLPRLIPQEDDDAAKELAKAFGKKGIALQLGKQCTKVEQQGNALTVHFGEGETVEADLMLVVGRPRADRRGPRPRGRPASRTTRARASPPTSTGARASRTSTPSATAPGYWQLAHTAFREGEVAAENAMRPRRGRRQPRRPAADLHRSRDRRRRPHRGGGARAVRRRRRGRPVPVGRERARRDAGRDDRLGQVDPRDAATASCSGS